MDDETTVTPATGASFLMVSPIQFRRLAKDGWFSAIGRNRFRLVDVVQGYIRSLQRHDRRLGTAADAARSCDISERRFRELLDAGVFERKAVGEYDLDEVTVTMIRQQRKAAAGRGDGIDLSTERAKLAVEQTKAAALRNNVLAGNLVAIDIASRIIERELMVLREGCLTLPGREADALCDGDPDRRSFIESHLRACVYEILNNLSEGKDIAGRAAAETAAR